MIRESNFSIRLGSDLKTGGLTDVQKDKQLESGWYLNGIGDNKQEYKPNLSQFYDNTNLTGGYLPITAAFSINRPNTMVMGSLFPPVCL